MSYSQERRLEKKFKCNCDCFTEENLRWLAVALRDMSFGEILAIRNLACEGDDCEVTPPGEEEPEPEPYTPIPGKKKEKEKAPCPNCGGPKNGEPVIPKPGDIPGEGTKGKIDAAICSPTLMSALTMVCALSGEYQPYCTAIKLALATYCKTGDKETLAMAMCPALSKLWSVAPMGIKMVMAGPFKPLLQICGAIDTPAILGSTLKGIFDSKKKSPTDLVTALMTGDTLQDIVGMMNGIITPGAAPADPVGGYLSSVVFLAHCTGADGLVYDVLDKMGVSIGKDGDIKPDNGTILSPKELDQLVFALSDWASSSVGA